LTPWRVISRIPNVFNYDCITVVGFENSLDWINVPGELFLTIVGESLRRRRMKKLFGWTGKLLRVDLAKKTVFEQETGHNAARFIGGRGLGEKYYWDLWSREWDAFHPDSALIVMTGPLAATSAPSASRWLMCGKSPSLYPENFASTNLGGFFGAQLKKAGYDGLIIQGKADGKVFLLVNNEGVYIRDATHLWGLSVSQTMQTLRREIGQKAAILTTGVAGENRVRFATLATDAGGSGSVGLGSVLGSKNVKAIAAHGTGTIPVADPETVQVIRQEIKEMTGEGYFNLYGSPPPLPGTEVVKKVHCHGCPQGCWRSLYKTDSGVEGVRKCQATFFYSMWDRKRHGDLTKATFLATSLINEYSLCTMELPGILTWLERCVENGIISEKETELPLEKAGSTEFAEIFIKKVATREGFGDLLAEGVMRAADSLGDSAKELALDHFTQSGRGFAYGPKVFSPSALIYATEVRPAVIELHEICEPLTKWALWYTTQGTFSYLSTHVLREIAKRFWGSEEAADFTHYEGKSRAAVCIQNRQHVKDSLILCDFAYPILDDTRTEDHVGDGSLESRLFSAVTGQETSESELNRTGEKIFNLYRAILLREGRRGREDDYLPESQFVERDEPVYDVFGMFNPDLYLPGKGGEVISCKGKALSRDGFEHMKNEYYQIRRWDNETGLLTREKLIELDLQEVIEPLGEKVL
jgi:aldehyde:ferredoxin oxidoreductase